MKIRSHVGFHAVIISVFTLFAAAGACAQADLAAGEGDIPAAFTATPHAADYTRIETMIPMRDGVKLFTVILIPKTVRGPMPIILTRTPYGAASYATAESGASPLMVMNVSPDYEPLVRAGYALAFQDVRGKFGSEGKYVLARPPRGPLNGSGIDHATDAWDTIEWLVKNVPGNNGKVGITGISYDGLLTLMALLDPHPALRAAVPVDAMVDGWLGDDWYHNGALRQTMFDFAYNQSSTKDNSLSVPYGYYDMYAAFLDAGSAAEFGRRHGGERLPAWTRIIDNPAYTAVWREQAMQRLLEKADSRVPTLTVKSLFDQEDAFGSGASYATLEKKDQHNDRNFLVVGPWHHGQSARRTASFYGKFPLGSDTARYFRQRVRQPFWDRYLKDIAPARPLAPVMAFETGANEWREYASWPPTDETQASRLYLDTGGRLSFSAPPPQQLSYTEYVSDPAKPVPYRVRPIRAHSLSYDTWEIWLSEDQRPFVDRPDVISFVSDELTEPLTVSGALAAHLFASTSGTDADWVVKLIDVFPQEIPAYPELGGYQFMVAADIFRGRYRESFEKAVPVEAGKVLQYRIRLPDVSHRFERGHRIMVQIQSTWFPLYDRNPQRFVPNIARANPADFQRATQRIHHSASAASFIELPLKN